MSVERSHVDYLSDILEAAGKVTDFVAGMTAEEFAKDDKTIFAVIRGLEIIGEATKRIPATFREQHPEIP